MPTYIEDIKTPKTLEFGQLLYLSGQVSELIYQMSYPHIETLNSVSDVIEWIDTEVLNNEYFKLLRSCETMQDCSETLQVMYNLIGAALRTQSETVLVDDDDRRGYGW